MGLKSGSRDAGLDEEETADERTRDAVGDHSQDAASETDASDRANDAARENTPSDAGDISGKEPTSDGSTRDRGSSETTDDESTDDGSTSDQSTDDRPSVESLPYVLRRNRVNEGRDQVPFFLREGVVEGERDLRETLEATLSEDVYKSDLREAAMVVAQERPELVAEVLRRWGYDLS